MWQTTSVSVSLENSIPASINWFLSWLLFSIIPLWTTATLSVICGWAFFSSGVPWVAQRVWPIPILPGNDVLSNFSSKNLKLPFDLTLSIFSLLIVAMPEES